MTGRRSDIQRWQRAALAAILALGAFVNGWGLWTLGYGNAYYAAAVQSMLRGWHSFLYASFDSAGFVSIDKPPLGFWIQAASAKLFGFSGVALMLPEAAAGVAAVALLHVLVARAWGRSAGLAAALLLAISPISVVASRSNIVDGELVLVLLLAAFAVVRAAETGRLRWLLLGALLVGLGFNVKMLEAYLVVPALGLLYLVAAPVRWWRRLAHLGAAAVVLVAVSLCWVAAVDLTPASQRPYVGSSAGNSELNLAIGYNGWSRVSGSPYRGRARTAAATAERRPAPPSRATLNGFSTRETGAAGPLRLLRQPLGSQTGWLLPLALIGLGAAAVRQRWGRPFDARQRSLLLWGGWMLTEGAFFSVASTVHAYYLTELSPSIAALAGIGIVVMVGEAARSARGRLVLAVAVAATAAEAARVLVDFPQWSRWLTPLVLGGAGVAVLVMLLWRRVLRGARWPVALAAATGTAALIAAPATWTGYSVSAHGFVALPVAGPPAGPQVVVARRFAGRGGGAGFGTGSTRRCCGTSRATGDRRVPDGDARGDERGAVHDRERAPGDGAGRVHGRRPDPRSRPAGVARLRRGGALLPPPRAGRRHRPLGRRRLPRRHVRRWGERRPRRLGDRGAARWCRGRSGRRAGAVPGCSAASRSTTARPAPDVGRRRGPSVGATSGAPTRRAAAPGPRRQPG